MKLRTHKKRMRFFIQFNNIPSQHTKENIERSGIKLLDYIPNYTYISSIPEGYNTQNLTNFDIRSISAISGTNKMSKSILSPPYPAWALNDDGTINLVVKYYKNIDPAAVKSAINNKNIEIISSNDYSQLLTLVIETGDIDKVANFPFIVYLESIPHPPVPDGHGAGGIPAEDVGSLSRTSPEGAGTPACFHR
jgi:hypothetical protein